LLAQKVEDYRRHAEECRSLARRSRSPEERKMLMNMTKSWDDLATHREAPITPTACDHIVASRAPRGFNTLQSYRQLSTTFVRKGISHAVYRESNRSKRP
jgi:hypothetical protein